MAVHSGIDIQSLFGGHMAVNTLHHVERAVAHVRYDVVFGGTFEEHDRCVVVSEVVESGWRSDLLSKPGVLQRQRVRSKRHDVLSQTAPTPHLIV